MVTYCAVNTQNKFIPKQHQSKVSFMFGIFYSLKSTVKYSKIFRLSNHGIKILDSLALHGKTVGTYTFCKMLRLTKAT
jgi:hypothetical protein